MSDIVAGGWTAFNFELTTEAKQVFAEAVNQLMGVKYTPFAFATQVVAGTNYCFLSQALPIVPNAQLRVVKVYVYRPLQGQAHVTQIVQITP